MSHEKSRMLMHRFKDIRKNKDITIFVQNDYVNIKNATNYV